MISTLNKSFKVKANNAIPNESNRKGIYLVPEDILDGLVATQDRILAILEAKKDATLNGFIAEKDAIAMVNKKTTWFWQMRKTGQLPFKKIGHTIYYSKDDLNSLLQS
jgi:hypothetical protein